LSKKNTTPVSYYFKEMFSHILTFFTFNGVDGRNIDVYIVNEQSYCYIHCILRSNSLFYSDTDYVFYHASKHKVIQSNPIYVKLVTNSAWKNSKYLCPVWTLWLNTKLHK